MPRFQHAPRAPRRRKPRPRSFWQRVLLRFGWLFPLAAIGVSGAVLALTYAFASIPLPSDIRLPSAAEVYDRHNNLIGVFSSEERRFLIDTDQLLKNHPHIGQAVVATEDKDFYDHNGLSLRGMARAAWADLTAGEIQQGGSTISQQYIKNAVLQDTGRTVTRKLKEAVLAIKLERRYSKNQILGFYLNTVYFGRGAYGIEAAARSYFDKHANQLDLGEAAYLAGIIPAPESYQPDVDPQIARERRDRVLQLMQEQGYISAAEEARFATGKVKLAPGVEDVNSGKQEAAYFMEWLRRELEREYGPALYTKGYEIHTTLDLRYQDAAENAVSSILTEPDDPEAALVSVTPTGAVRALVGGRAFESVKKARGFNFASDNYRQPGSAFKPFTLLTAINEGISPQSRFSGASPATITDPECADPEDGLWQPENFEGSSYGTITLIEATTNSVNTVYARLIAEIGPQPVADLLGDFKFDGDPRTPKRDPMPPNCSLALGTPDVSPLEMARAYAGFAARGKLPEIQPLVYVERADGTCVKVYRPTEGGDCGKGDEDLSPPQQVVEQNSVDVMNQVLTNVVEGGTGTAADIGRPVAGKTGTTQDNVDAWFAGYTPQLATVVWMGYPAENNGNLVPQMRACEDPKLCRPVHGYDVTGGGSPVSPAPIWAAFMQVAMTLDDFPIVSFPIPLDQPDEIINPPPPPEPEPTKTPEPEPTKTPEPEPTKTPKPEPTKTPKPEPTKTPKPEPTKTPEPEPTKSPGPDRGGKGNGGGNGGGNP